MSRVNFYWYTAVASVLIVIAILILLPVVIMSNQVGNAEYLNMKVGLSQLRVEVANTPLKQARGLSGRSNLSPNAGMLFVYKNPTNHNFWMKDMKFALDFIWILENQVVQIDQNIKPPESTEVEPARIYPQQNYDMVLEVNAGWVDAEKINLGDKVELESI